MQFVLQHHFLNHLRAEILTIFRCIWIEACARRNSWQLWSLWLCYFPYICRQFPWSSWRYLRRHSDPKSKIPFRDSVITGHQKDTGKSFSEAHILALVNPPYDKRLFIEFPEKYMLTFKTIFVHKMLWTCIFWGIQWIISCHNLGYLIQKIELLTKIFLYHWIWIILE